MDAKNINDKIIKKYLERFLQRFLDTIISVFVSFIWYELYYFGALDFLGVESISYFQVYMIIFIIYWIVSIFERR